MVKDFHEEIAFLKTIKWEGYSKTLRKLGLSYLGKVGHSAKLRHSLYNKVATYGVYLASADLSGYNICPNSTYCKENCLNGSGHNRMNRMQKDGDCSRVDGSRITKTRLFFANREVFMRLMIHEINVCRMKAEKDGNFFSIRLNCTSDISPLAFKVDGKNILEMYNDIQFYDYTKVPNRLKLPKAYKNYHVTWSIDGSEENERIGINYLKKGGHVAMVYYGNMPTRWNGFETCDGDLTDYRPSDDKPVCALKFKVTNNNFKNGHFLLPNTKFIVTENSEKCAY